MQFDNLQLHQLRDHLIYIGKNFKPFGTITARMGYKSSYFKNQLTKSLELLQKIVPQGQHLTAEGFHTASPADFTSLYNALLTLLTTAEQDGYFNLSYNSQESVHVFENPNHREIYNHCRDVFWRLHSTLFLPENSGQEKAFIDDITKKCSPTQTVATSNAPIISTPAATLYYTPNVNFSAQFPAEVTPGVTAEVSPPSLEKNNHHTITRSDDAKKIAIFNQKQYVIFDEKGNISFEATVQANEVLIHIGFTASSFFKLIKTGGTIVRQVQTASPCVFTEDFTIKLPNDVICFTSPCGSVLVLQHSGSIYVVRAEDKGMTRVDISSPSEIIQVTVSSTHLLLITKTGTTTSANLVSLQNLSQANPDHESTTEDVLTVSSCVEIKENWEEIVFVELLSSTHFMIYGALKNKSKPGSGTLTVYKFTSVMPIKTIDLGRQYIPSVSCSNNSILLTTDKGVHFLSEEKHYNDKPNRFVWNELADSVLLPDGKKAIGMTPNGWVQFYNPKNLAEQPTSFFQL